MNSFRYSVCVLVIAATTSMVAADDNSEPPVVYTLEINGKPYALSPDKPLKIDGDFSNPTVTLRVAKIRTLQAAGISFDFPAYFTFEADTSDPDVQTWTAEGNDVTLMLFNFSEEVDPQALAQSTAEALEAKKTEFENIMLKLGESDRKGVKATMSLGNQSLIQQTFILPPTENGSRLLVVQEVRSEGESAAAELGETLKLIASSLKVTP